MALAVDLVRRGAARFPDRTAVLFEDRSLTYREVDEAANRFAQVLIGQGVSPGDRVACSSATASGRSPWTSPASRPASSGCRSTRASPSPSTGT